MEIRLVHNPEDQSVLSAISVMLETSLSEEMRYPFEGLLPYFRNGKMHLYAAYSGEVCVGFAVVIVARKSLYILFLVVDEKQRSKGYGTAIISALKKEYPRLSIVLDCEEDRVSFYERCGIHETGYKMEFRNTLLYVMCESKLNLRDFMKFNKVLEPLEKDDDTDFVWIEPDGSRHTFSH